MLHRYRLAPYQPMAIEHSEEDPEEETPQAMPHKAYSLASPLVTAGEGRPQ